MTNWTKDMRGEDIIGSFLGGCALAGILFAGAMCLLFSPVVIKLMVVTVIGGGIFGTYAHYRANRPGPR